MGNWGQQWHSEGPAAPLPGRVEAFPDTPEPGWEEKPQKNNNKIKQQRGVEVSLRGAAGGRAGPGAAPRWVLAFPKSLSELTSAGGSCFPSGKPRHDPCAAQDRAGSGHRMWGRRQRMKIPRRLWPGPQGTAPARCFHLAAGDGYRARRALPFRPLKQTAGYPDSERG